MDRFEQLLTVCMSTPLETGSTAPHKPGCAWGINLNVIGAPGTGKSKRIVQAGRYMGLNVYPIYCSTKSPEHIGGFPVMTPMGFTLECALPQVRSAIDDGKAIIFLDEISSAPPAVQAALLSFVNERTIGEYMLPPGVRIVLAMNPADVAANGRELEVPMANRILHWDYSLPSVRAWGAYTNDTYDPGFLDVTAAEDIVREKWFAHFDAVHSAICAFLEAAGGTYVEKNEEGKDVTRSKFLDQPAADDPRASGPWPSPRTWQLAMNGVTAARCLGMDASVQSALVGGLVGKGLAAELSAYMKKANLPHPKDVLTNGWAIPKQLDIVRIVLNECAGFAALEKDEALKDKYLENCLKLLLSAYEHGKADIIAKPFSTLLHAGADIYSTNSAISTLSGDLAAHITTSGHVNYIRGV